MHKVGGNTFDENQKLIICDDDSDFGFDIENGI